MFLKELFNLVFEFIDLGTVWCNDSNGATHLVLDLLFQLLNLEVQFISDLLIYDYFDASENSNNLNCLRNVDIRAISVHFF